MRRQVFNTTVLLARCSHHALERGSSQCLPLRQPRPYTWSLTTEVALIHSLWTGQRRGIAGGDVQRLLDSMQATRLRDSLEVEADVRPFMSYVELLEFIKKEGAADTDDEAHQRADALVKAGVVLRFNGVVYLRPQEVSELLCQALPTDPERANQHLTEVETELTMLDKQYRQLQETAQRWPRFWLRAGCAAVAVQLGVFYYLTYWELSWDVMEPVAYILSLTYSLLAYMYFLYTRGSYFDLQPFQEYWTERQLEKKMSEKGFDLEHYKHLMRARERYRRYLAAQAHTTQAAGHITQEHSHKAKLV